MKYLYLPASTFSKIVVKYQDHFAEDIAWLPEKNCKKLMQVSIDSEINTIKYKNMMDVARSFLRLASHKKYELTIGCLV